MIVGPALLSALFSMPSCAGIDRRVLYGIVATESAANPFAIHDDSDGRSYFPSDRPMATGVMARLDRAGHAYSAGIMQIENTNWRHFHVTGVQLLDARTSVAVGCQLYRENVSALRLYNTGTPAPTVAGNRYAEAVFSAGRVISTAPLRISIHTPPTIRVRPRRHPSTRTPYNGFGFSVRAEKRSASDL